MNNQELMKVIEKFEDEYVGDNTLTKISSRETFHVISAINERLDNLINYIDATSSTNSKLNEDMTVKGVKRKSDLAYGFKSKFISYLLNEALEGLDTPTVKKIRFKHGKTTRRAYLFTENNILTLVLHDARGKELKYLSSETESEEYINNEFQKYIEQSNE